MVDGAFVLGLEYTYDDLNVGDLMVVVSSSNNGGDCASLVCTWLVIGREPCETEFVHEVNVFTVLYAKATRTPLASTFQEEIMTLVWSTSTPLPVPAVEESGRRIFYLT